MPTGIYERTEEHKNILKNNSLFKNGHKINVGQKNHQGYTHSESTKKIISDIQKQQFAQGNRKIWCEGKKLSESHIKNLSESRKGYLMSSLQKDKISKANGGENHWNWQGGKTTIKRRIWALREYQKWRSKVFKRDNYHCQNCGVVSEKGIKVKLEAHHIIPFAKILTEFNIQTIEEALNCGLLWDVGNGITYCRECHLLLDNNIGRPIQCHH